MILLLLSNTAATVRSWLHDPGLMASADLGLPYEKINGISSLWLHGPLLNAAALQSGPAPPTSGGYRNRWRDLPAYIDELDEDEEEAIFGLLAGHVFG